MTLREIVLIVGIAAASVFGVKQCSEKQDVEERYEECITEVIDIDKQLGQKQEEIDSTITIARALELDNDKLLKENGALDGLVLKKNSQIKTLTNYVTKLKASHTTNTEVTFPTDSIPPIDSILPVPITDSVLTDTVYPIYTTDYLDEWLSYRVKASQFDTDVHIIMRDEVKFAVYKKKTWWGRETTSEVQAVSLNPYVVEKKLNSFVIEDKDPKLSLGVQLGLGITNTLTPAYYIGVGAQYNLLHIY